MRLTKLQVQERDEAIERLRGWIKPGDTVYTILDHVSSSGMSRHIRVVVPYTRDDNGQVDHLHPNHAIGLALGIRHGRHNGHVTDALLLQGCGMDMGFHLVYELSHCLYPEYQCLGKRRKCPSNYHNNYRSWEHCEGADGHFCHYDRNAGPLSSGLWVLQDGTTCPTCKGTGRLENPKRESWRLKHTDGYAVSHRWL